MNQKRQIDYHLLINVLLVCPSDKEEILQSKRELIDAGFVKTMLEVAKILEQRGDLTSANYLRKIAIQLEAAQLLQQGIELHRTSQFKASLQLLRDALNIYRQIGNRQGEVDVLSVTGNAYDFLGKYQEAINCHELSLEIASKIGGSAGKAKKGMCLGNLGKTYSSLGKYHEAVDCQKQSLEIAQEFENHHAAATALGNLGHNFFSLGRYDKAIDYHQQQLNLVREIITRLNEGKVHNNFLLRSPEAINEFKKEEINALGSLGLIFYAIGEEKQAMAYYQESLDIARKIEARFEEANNLANIAAAYCNFSGKYDEAIKYFNQSLTIYQELDSLFGKACSLSGLGMV